MVPMKTVGQWMAARAIESTQLVEKTGLDKRVVEAIVLGQYTPSPQQRASVSQALGVDPEDVAWGHQVEVEHFYGHGEQFGRSP